MNKLVSTDLWKLEDYARERAGFRTRVLAHKAARSIALGEHINLLFEDRLTVHYQVQEMLRIERIFEPAGIDDELAAYNPLIPDGHNLKATMLIEYPDEAQRRAALRRLRDVENRIFIQIGQLTAVFAIADEDLPRSNEEKTSAVHFLRFELDTGQRTALRDGAALQVGVDHPEYKTRTVLPESKRSALLADLD